VHLCAIQYACHSGQPARDSSAPGTDSIPGYSISGPSGCAGFSPSSRCQRWWRGAGGALAAVRRTKLSVCSEPFRVHGGGGSCIRRPFTDCSASYINTLIFPSFPCSFDGAEGPKPPGGQTTTLSLLSSLSLDREREAPVAYIMELPGIFLRGVYPDLKRSQSLIAQSFIFGAHGPLTRNRLRGRVKNAHSSFVWSPEGAPDMSPGRSPGVWELPSKSSPERAGEKNPLFFVALRISPRVSGMHSHLSTLTH